MQWLKESRESPTPDDLRGVSSFEAVFAEVEADRAFFGILPIENSSSGSLHQVYDCLLKSPLNIVGELGMVEEHCLVSQRNRTSVHINSNVRILHACLQSSSQFGTRIHKYYCRRCVYWFVFNSKLHPPCRWAKRRTRAK